MALIKEDIVVESQWLWQFDDDGERDIDIFNAPEKLYCVFGIFILDKFIPEVTDDILGTYNKRLSRLLEPWNKFYPWSEYNGVTTRIDAINGRKFIFGQLCVEDNATDEESLIVTLLRKFSIEQGSNIFIKIADTDGDFLMMESHDVLPKEYDFPVGNNRLWLHEGNFILIPNVFHTDRGLTTQESLTFLTDSFFKCSAVGNINKRLDEKFPIKDFPDSQLNRLCNISLQIESKLMYKSLKNNPRIINYLIKNVLATHITPIRQNSQTTEDNFKTPQNLDVVASKSHASLLLLYLESHKLKNKNDKSNELHCGNALTDCYNRLINEGYIKTTGIGNLDTVKINDDISSIFKDYEFENIPMDRKYEPSENFQPNEQLMETFTKFFNDSEIPPKEAVNQYSSIPQEKTTKSMNDENVDIINDDILDEQARNYFKNENIDISEDDFFEFFLKEALHMKNEDIDAMTNDKTKKDTVKDEGLNKFEPLEEFEDLFEGENSQEELSKAMESLFQSLSVEGMPNNPFESILRNLDNNNI